MSLFNKKHHEVVAGILNRRRPPGSWAQSYLNEWYNYCFRFADYFEEDCKSFNYKTFMEMCEGKHKIGNDDKR